MFVSLSVCHLSVSLCLSVHLHLSVHLSIHLSICLSVSLCVSLSVCVSVYLSVCLSIHTPLRATFCHPLPLFSSSHCLFCDCISIMYLCHVTSSLSVGSPLLSDGFQPRQATPSNVNFTPGFSLHFSVAMVNGVAQLTYLGDPKTGEVHKRESMRMEEGG